MSAAETTQYLAQVRNTLSQATDALSRHQLAPAMSCLAAALGTTILVIDGIVQELQATAQGGVSSVQLEQGAKEIRATVKAYAGSDVRQAGEAALAELERLINAVRDAQGRDWQATVDLLADRVAEGVGDP